MSVNLSPVGGAGAQFSDNNGHPLNGGKLYTYSAGTTTPAATYTSSTGVTFHPNPIVLNAGGRVPDSGEIWLADNISYKFVLKTSADVLIATWDNINGINSNFVNYTIQEEVITATAGQTVFDLTTITYAPATNSLAVYIDGVNQIVDDSYLETDANTVTFVSGLHEGALVKFTTAVPATGTATNADVVTYDPPFTGAVAYTVQDKLAQTVSVKDFGAVGDGVTDDTAAIQAAVDSGALNIRIPSGTYKITSAANTYGVRVTADNLTITGDGFENTTLVYTSSATNQPGLLVQADGVLLDGFTIDGSANATNAGAGVASNCHDISIEDSNDCQVSNCGVIGGHYGIHLDNNGSDYTVNANNRVINCVARNTASSGFQLTRASFALVQGCDAKNAGTDGFKTAGYTYRTRIIGNTATGCTRDGFDLYDGFIESVLADNVSDSNTLQGYEIKGTFDGTNYVIRDSLFSNNLAVNNGFPGFQITSVRNCTFTGNQATSNQREGFAVNTVQGCSFTGNVASKNVRHGFSLEASVSRTIFAGCFAVDNSWVDGTTQNGTYHGFNISAGCSAQFTGCSSINGTTTGQKGGQGYGWYWVAVVAGSSLINCYSNANVTGGIGGAAGWANNNGILNFNNNGTFKGIQYTDDALTALKVDGGLYPTTTSTYALGSATNKWTYIHHSNKTVATLPAPATIGSGARTFVDNSSVAAAGNFGAVVVGGGSNIVPVYCDGTDWRIG